MGQGSEEGTNDLKRTIAL